MTWMDVHKFRSSETLQNATGRYSSWRIRGNQDVMSTSRSTARHSFQGDTRTPTTTSLRVVTSALKARIPGPSTIQTRGTETIRFELHGEKVEHTRETRFEKTFGIRSGTT
jgi:hypothetical protein